MPPDRPAPPAADLGSVGADPTLSPLAFEVAHFGDGAAGGYGVFDERGGIGRTFRTAAEAQRHAAAQKAAYEARSQAATPAQTPIPPAPSPGGFASARVPIPPRSKASAQAAAMASAPVPNRAPVVPAVATTAAAPATSPSASRSSAVSGRGAFERAFDASIGKAITGAEKIVTGSLDAFKRGYAGVKTAAGNPAATYSAFSSSASRAAFSAQVVAAFAAARARGVVGASAAKAFGWAGVGANLASRKQLARRAPGGVARAAAIMAARMGSRAARRSAKFAARSSYKAYRATSKVAGVAAATGIGAGASSPRHSARRCRPGRDATPMGQRAGRRPMHGRSLVTIGSDKPRRHPGPLGPVGRGPTMPAIRNGMPRFAGICHGL